MKNLELKGKRALVLGASKWQVPLIRQVKSMGLEVVATDMNPNAVGLTVADYGEVVDILDADANTRIAMKYNVNAVLTDQTDYALNVVAKVASRLVIPGPSEDVARNCTNKRLMREITSKAGVKNPRFYVAESLVDARLAASHIGFPLVIKPTDNQGSRGVFKIDDLHQLIELFSHSIIHSRENKVLIEEYIKGTEVTVEGFVSAGKLHVLAISEKKHTPPPRIIAMNLEFPPEYPSSVMKEIEKSASYVAESLGMKNGPYHGEFLVNDDGVFLVEAAHRGGGSGTSSHIVPAVSGVNMLEKLVLSSLGHKVEIKPSKNNACILKFLEFTPGPVLNITGLENAKKLHGVQLFEINYGPGEIISQVTDDSKRHGCIIASSSSKEEARRIIERAINMVSIVYDSSAEKSKSRELVRGQKAPVNVDLR